MKIRLERTGGFAGMTRTLEVDIDSLPENERSLVTGMINDADFFALPSVVPRNEQSGADLYNYRITIESADGLHTVEATQLSVPESLEPLIVWLDRRPSGDSSDASNRP